MQLFLDVEEIPEENWRGKNKSGKIELSCDSRRGPKSMLLPLKEPYKKLTFLENFYTLRGKTTVRTNNTCGMDSAFYVFCALYADCSYVRDIFNKCPSSCRLSNLIKIAHTAKNSNEIYKTRNEILLEVFEEKKQQFSNGLIEIDCSCSINYLLQKICCSHFYSCQTVKTCDLCNYENLNERRFLDFDLKAFEISHITQLNKLLNDELARDTRFKCKCPGSVKRTVLNDLVIIDLQMEGDLKHLSIANLSHTLELLNDNFKLVSLIEFIGNARNVDAVGHYVCHVLRKMTNGKDMTTWRHALPKVKLTKSYNHRFYFILKTKKFRLFYVYLVSFIYC